MTLETINNNDLRWIYIQKPTRDDLHTMGKKYRFHELNLEDCLSKRQILKIDRYEDHSFIILQFPAIERTKDYILQISQLSIFIGKNFLVTTHQGDLKALAEIFYLCKQSDKQRQMVMGKSSGYLLHSIIDVIVDDILHILMKVGCNLEDIEDAVFDEKIAVIKEISYLRRDNGTLRRAIIPLITTVSETANDIARFAEEDLTPYFNDVKDHLNKIFEILEQTNDTIEMYKDAHAQLSTERTNKILTLLTILSTLGLPFTIIGTVYGMIINQPGAIKIDSSGFFGIPITIIIVPILSLLPPFLMLWYFRRSGWFSR